MLHRFVMARLTEWMNSASEVRPTVTVTVSHVVKEASYQVYQDHVVSIRWMRK